MSDTFQMPPMPDLPPEATLITAPVGAGKTAAAIDAIIETRQLSAFSTIWVLLANRQQIQAFRERLLVASPDAVQFGVEFFDFDDLYARVLDVLGHPQRQIEDTARYQVLREVAARLRDDGQLECFGEIVHYPGFIGLLAGLIHELKQGLVRLEDFERVTATRGPKDRDLFRIYEAYQLFLLHNTLVDRHGAGWLAIEFLEEGAQLPPVDLLVVDGFDQFNVVQIRLLTALAQQVQRTFLTMTAAPAAPGRRFHRFEHTLDRVLRLGRATGRDEYLWQIEALRPALVQPVRPPALEHLIETIFAGQPNPVPAEGALHLIEAPDPIREVGIVLRRIKRWLLDGVPPDSIAIIARGIDRYSGTLHEIARAYGMPLLVRHGIPLRASPVVELILALTDLAALDFPRRDVLDVLHSPYLALPGLTPEQITLLERISREAHVLRGRDVWLAALDDAARPDVDRRREDEDRADQPSADQVEIEALADDLRAFFDRITPPARATAYAYTRWIAALIGPDPAARALDAAEAANGPAGAPAAHFGVLEGVRAVDDPERVTRDMAACRVLQGVLRGIRAAHDLLAADGEPALIDWADFRAELQLAVDRANVTPPGGANRAGRVIATDVLNARGLPHDHVVILGLAEGIFPALEVDIALYQEGERVELEAAGIDMLTAVERSDDMSLFYQAVGLARQTLTLSRFTVDDRGAPLPASPFWRAVRAVVLVPDDQIERIGVGGVPTLAEAATLTEAAVAVSAALSGEHDPGALAVDSVHNALLDHPAWAARWRNVLHGRALDAWRTDPAAPFDRFSGVLEEPALVAVAEERLGPGRVWSASQLNEYGTCPFRFFAHRLLKLEELEEPQEGLDPLQLGSINHAILELTYRQLTDEERAIVPENRDRALAILAEMAEAVFATAPRQYGFRPSPVWKHEQAEMLRRLRWLIELDFSADNPLVLGANQRATSHPVAAAVTGLDRYPYRQEAVFGEDETPLMLDGEAGPVWVRGVIDRLDRAGDHLIVVDYKSGSTPHRVEDMREGRDVQMTLYLLAAQALQRQLDPSWSVIGGLFWHVRNRKTSGEVLAEDFALVESLDCLHRHIVHARAGIFPVFPSKRQGGKCTAHCEFSALCRLDRANFSKPVPADPLYAD